MRLPWTLAISLILSVAFAGCSDDNVATPAASDGGCSACDAGSSFDASPSDASDGDVSAADAGTNDAGDPERTMILRDVGQSRFSPRAFSDYTCPNVPGYGRVISWTIPSTLAAALTLPGAGPFTLRVTSGNSKNVSIFGPSPSETVYFEGSTTIALTNRGTFPTTTLDAKPPLTGELLLDGKWICP